MLHTSTTPSLPHPYWVTAFADAESSFILLLNKNSKYKTGYSLQTSFSIHLHQKERALLERIASFYGGGNITKTGEDSISYRVTSLKDLIQVIIPHFNRYPLISKKRADYELFKQVVELMNRKEHLTPAGLRKIVAIKASINLGLPDRLNTAFPNINPLSRPSVQLPAKIDPH